MVVLFPVYLKAAIFLQTRFGEEQCPFYTHGPRLIFYALLVSHLVCGPGSIRLPRFYCNEICVYFQHLLYSHTCMIIIGPCIAVLSEWIGRTAAVYDIVCMFACAYVQ